MSTTGENRLNLYRSSMREMPRVLRDPRKPVSGIPGAVQFESDAGGVTP